MVEILKMLSWDWLVVTTILKKISTLMLTEYKNIHLVVSFWIFCVWCFGFRINGCAFQLFVCPLTANIFWCTQAQKAWGKKAISEFRAEVYSGNMAFLGYTAVQNYSLLQYILIYCSLTQWKIALSFIIINFIWTWYYLLESIILVTVWTIPAVLISIRHICVLITKPTVHFYWKSRSVKTHHTKHKSI